jgi:hypothetical protein
MAADMAKQMVPELLKSLVSAHAAEKKTVTKVKGKPGRKPKVKAPEVVVPEPIVQNTQEPAANPLVQESVS